MLDTWKLNVRWDIQDSVTVVTVGGRLGCESSGTLIETLLDVVGQGHQRILIDLGQVDYVSSAGLLALDAAGGRIHEAGGILGLCGLCEPVRLVLELAGLLEELVVEPSREAGLARMRRIVLPDGGASRRR